jgi:orotidine-5'-phosphate decarboxylase
MPKPIRAKERLIFALDVPGEQQARRLVKRLHGVVSFYKVGWELFVATGLRFVKELKDQGHKVFLDLKITPDVDEQLRRTVRILAQAGVEFMTIHGNGKTAKIVKQARGDLPVKILSITALTSMDVFDLRDLYITDPHSDLSFKFGTVEDFVRFRAAESLNNGCDGLIASGKHAKLLRDEFGKDFILVCPGIRPEGCPSNEHKRAATPAEAIANGADYLVVGRPIRDAGDPKEAAQKIIDEIKAASSPRTLNKTIPSTLAALC